MSMTLDTREQLQFIAVLAYELEDYLETSPRFLDWPKLGALVKEADGDFKKLEVLIVGALVAATDDCESNT